METLPPSQERIRAGRGGARLPLGKRSRLARCCPERGRKTPAGLGDHGAGAWHGVPGLCTLIAPSQRVQDQLLALEGGGDEPPEPGQWEGGRGPGPRALPVPQVGATGCTQALTSADSESPHGMQGLI